MRFPLETSSAEALGLAREPLERLYETITRHIAEGRYPGAQIAIARHGRLAVFQSFGDARRAPQPPGGIPERGRAGGSVGGPRAPAQARVRVPARVGPGIARALSQPGRAL